MKTIVFKSAWSIFKLSNVSFSEALIMAWSKFKSGLKAVVVKSNKLIKSKGLGYETIYFNELVFTNIIVPVGICNNDGAKIWYDGKTFNND